MQRLPEHSVPKWDRHWRWESALWTGGLGWREGKKAEEDNEWVRERDRERDTEGDRAVGKVGRDTEHTGAGAAH